jgi:SAM-dependent methyltransferase
MKCRHCSTPLTHTFLDLGFAPPSNAYLTASDLNRPETYFPLRVMVCDSCWLVQTEEGAKATDLFTADYAYFSSTSTTWLEHAKAFVEAISNVLALGPQSHVIEVAANDGYLLKNFVAKGIPCVGIEPTASTADAAERLRIPIIREFFGEALAQRLAEEGRQADLIIGNNVYAHVPDINDFTRGLCAALKPEGVVSLEFPHVMRLIEHAQFDTVYHEHFSYLSLSTVARIFDAAGLRVWKVEELTTHGGSLRVYGCHRDSNRVADSSVAALLEEEACRGVTTLDAYVRFQPRANRIKNDLLAFLIDQHRAGKKVVAYGAAAKGNTLLNFAGVKPDLLGYVCDRAASKQGKFMPGSHIPIVSSEHLQVAPPDFVLILPWNIADEVKRVCRDLIGPDVRFVCAVPRFAVTKS